MTVTAYSFIMALLWSSIFVILMVICRKHQKLISMFGVSLSILFFIGFTLRLMLPVEFSFAKAIYDYETYAELKKIVTNDISESISISLVEVFVIIWVVVSIILLLRMVFVQRSFMRTINKLNNSITLQMIECQKELEEEVQRIKAKIICSPVFKVPMCTGLKMKYILLPDLSYEEEELYFILKHEYTHLKNNDIYIKMFIEVFIAIFWWNPFAYLLRYNLNHVLEVKCDLSVVDNQSIQVKTVYLNTIINIIKSSPDEKFKKRHFVTAEFVGSANSENVKQRFLIVCNYTQNKISHRITLFVSAMVMVITLLVSYKFVLQPAYNPPQSEIAEDGGYEITLENAYILKSDDGKCILKTNNGDSFELTDEDIIAQMISDDFKIKGE